MHTAAIHKENVQNSWDFGWDFDSLNDYNSENSSQLTQKAFSWQKLVSNIKSYIKGLNFGYKSKLHKKDIKYVNALASFNDKNSLVYSTDVNIINKHLNGENLDEFQNKIGKITADYFVISVGGRPNLLPEKICKNAKKFALTSDDIFYHNKSPNRTLVVGGGYIALECASFLNTLGFPVTLMTRAIFLRSNKIFMI